MKKVSLFFLERIFARPLPNFKAGNGTPDHIRKPRISGYFQLYGEIPPGTPISCRAPFTSITFAPPGPGFICGVFQLLSGEEELPSEVTKAARLTLRSSLSKNLNANPISFRFS